MSTRQACSREIAALLTHEITNIVDSKQTGRVMLVGCEHIELLIQLANAGFIDVTCRTGLAGPNPGEMSADMIIVPAVDREPRLAALLSQLERCLRPDGLLLLCGASTQLSTRTRQVRKLLTENGFADVRSHLEPTDVQLLCCRKISPLQAQAA